MPYLKDFPWWPKGWIAQSGTAPTPAEIRMEGTLKNALMLDGASRLLVDYKGVIYTATIIPGLTKDALILLHKIILRRRDLFMAQATEKCAKRFTEAFANFN